MRLVYDIEANGLYQEVDTLWCMCAKDIDTGEKYQWSVTDDEGPEAFLEMLGQATEIICHNQINYDSGS